MRSASLQRGGNKQLKNLLLFSCNPLIGADNRFERRDGCRARGTRHNRALKAVARKRLKVNYAIMRGRGPVLGLGRGPDNPANERALSAQMDHAENTSHHD